MLYRTIIDLHLVVIAALAVGLIRGGRTLWLMLFLNCGLCSVSTFLVVFVPGDPIGKALFDLGLATLFWLCGVLVKNE